MSLLFSGPAHALCALRGAFLRTAGTLSVCRGCLGPLDAGSEAGLCGRCWDGLLPLPASRCPGCALVHGEDRDCPEAVAWNMGDAFWDYHGGRPALGAMLVPGIKHGEMGWRGALLKRAERRDLPAFAMQADIVCCAPTASYRRWVRGFDLAEDAARQLASRIQRPYLRLLSKDWRHRRQMGQTESERRLLPKKAVRLIPGRQIQGLSILLVDDVWTTGTTLLRCAQALHEGGAKNVNVLTLFRAM